MNSTTPDKSKINLIESTDLKDRPTEAVAQLRDIAGWLRAEGYHFMADYTDDVADSIAHAYEV